MDRLTFLGTGGGRFACILQARATGGLYLQLSKDDSKPLEGDNVMRIHIDPGPGALVRMLAKGFDPLKTDALLVSHCHPDHYGDTEILVEGMTEGGSRKRGALITSKSVLFGYDEFGPSVSKYHLSKPELVKGLAPGDSVDVFGLKVEATHVVHSDPTSIGFRIHTKQGIIGYVSDTALDPAIGEANRGSRILVLPVTRPLGARIPFHLDVDDASKIVEAVKPEIVFLNHFGMRVVKDGPEFTAHWIYKKTGIRTIASEDNMDVNVGNDIDVLGKPQHDDV
jgi:phosphoribosyl 1,2-cyclic phosphodiesterase